MSLRHREKKIKSHTSRKGRKGEVGEEWKPKRNDRREEAIQAASMPMRNQIRAGQI
jgi:hypothetical protein